MLSIQEASIALGVSKSTLRRWDAEGRIPVSRSLTGRRMFDIDAIKGAQTKHIILYARVSSRKQVDDLQRQKAYLRDNLPPQFNTAQCKEINDVGSGINFKRKGLTTLLEQVLSNTVQTVVVASRDRLCRFGFELVEWMCQQHGTNILVLNNQDTTPEQELGEDLMSIVQVYCCRWNGKRRYKNNHQVLEVTSSSNTSTEAHAGAMGTCVTLHLQCNNECPQQPKSTKKV